MADAVALKPLEAAALVDEAAWAAARAYRQAPHTAVEETARLRWLITGTPYYGLNGVFWAHNGEPDLVDVAMRPFYEAEVPMLWHVGPTSDPDLPEKLHEIGLTHHAEEPGMVQSLGPAHDRAGRGTGGLADGADLAGGGVEPPVWLEIRRVGTVSELRAWVRIWAGPASPLVTDRLVALRAPAAFGAHARTPHFLGVADGEPVACAAVWVGRPGWGRGRWRGAPVAWVEHVSALPVARGRGIGTAMTWECLRVARDRKADRAVLTATAEAAPLYRRLGFQDVCTVSRFLWTPR
ncbi:MAG: GNAT family N-acetyltransferase, partial [Micromonosporaceae bacterium]|nr:GNAT family N-acetyltransferase [Micromonosporaceae bacterium]